MDEEKNLLVTKRFKLARLIRADPIVSLLAAQRHISPHSAAKIQCKRSGFERNVALLTELSRRPRCSVEAFAKALLVTGQKHASDVLIMHNRLLHRTMTLHRGWDEADGSKRFVVPTDVEFYNRTKHDSYAMVSTPRGYALIIIVKSDVTLQANLNKSNLEELLLQLGYICNTIEVLSVSDAMNAIEEFSLKDKHKDVDSSVVSLLHNEQLPERDADNIVNMFDNSKCAHLRNKPKIFLLPAPVHSGRNYPLVQKRHLTCSSDLAESTSARLPTSSDFIVVLLHIGTADVTSKLEENRSIPFQAFLHSITKYAKTKDFADIITRANDSIRRRVQDSCMIIHFRSTLCKNLHFYPGIRMMNFER